MKRRQNVNAPGRMPILMKMMMVLLLFLGMGLNVHATPSPDSQQTGRNITGVVVDEEGEPVIGATVMIKGTDRGTTTGIDGSFTLNIAGGDKLLAISYVGMITAELEIGNKNHFEVVLRTDAVLMEDLVVIGYGTRSKRDVSIAVSSVKSEELNERPSAFNIMESIAGKVAGVTNISMSGRPGGSSSLRVRGMGSINAGKDPIYVLDGVVGVDPGIINSANIESIDILKDAAATAMYGAQGSNGVVLITTKKGKKGKGSITYDGNVGFGFMTRELDVLNADEYMEVQRRSYAYSGQVMPHLLTPDERLFYYAKDGSGNYRYDDNGLLIASPKYDTNWQKELTRTAVTNDHILSYSSGSDDTSIYASLGYQNHEGIVKGSEYERISGTVNVNSRIKEWLRMQVVGTVGSQKGNNNDMENSFGQGVVRNMIEMPPIVPVRYEDGTWGRKGDYMFSEEGENPLLLLRDRRDEWKQNFSLFSLNTTIDLSSKLTLTLQGDLQQTYRKRMSYAKAGLQDVSENNGGYADIYNYDNQKMSSENYFTYNDEYLSGLLRSEFVLGASWYYNRSESSSSGSEQFFDDSFGYHNLSAGTTWHEPTSGMDQNTMNSYYFRMNHNIKDRYLLGATFRADGASNFGANNKYGFFPSVSAGWHLSEEEFFEPLRQTVSQAKLRTSYGLVGNASIPSYRTISQYGNGTTIFNKELSSFVVLSNLGNKDLKWESSSQFNVGLDLGLLNNRFELILDFYSKSTRDLLFQKQVPITTGYSTTWTNLGEIRNNGFEATFTSRNINTGDFSWTTDLVYATNKLMTIDINGETIETGNNTIAREGIEWASYYVYRRLGTWSLQEVEEAAKYGKKPGDIKYEDVNGDYKIDEADRQLMGNGRPKGNLTMVNKFSYKGLSLLVDLNYVYGFKIMSITRAMGENRALYSNSMKTMLNAWIPENQNTMIAALRLPSDPYFGENEKDSFMLHKGDFLRLRNVSLTYTLGKEMLRWLKEVNGLTVGVSAENLALLTAYPGYDTELGAFSTDNGQSIDFYSYPRPTTITANLKITF